MNENPNHSNESSQPVNPYSAPVANPISNVGKYLQASRIPPKDMLTTFAGRIPRSTWWLYMIIVGITGGIINYILGMVLGGNLTLFMLASVVVQLAYLYVACAISAKRWHDRNKPAMMNLILVGITLIGLIVTFQSRALIAKVAGLQAAMANPATAQQAAADLSAMGASMATGSFGILSIISLGLSLWLLVELGCLRGTVGPNTYGEDPLPAPLA